MGLPDVQNEQAEVKLRIPQVGVENINLPMLIELREGGFREVVANISIRTDLNDNVRGISMSRLPLTLDKYKLKPLKQVVIIDILGDLNRKVGSKSSFVRFSFKLPITRNSPRTGHAFPVFHNCMFEGALDDGVAFYQGVTVQYISYCPCSHQLARIVNGIPHSQRSYANVIIQNETGVRSIWLEDIIETVEEAVVNLPYPIVKREDEQMIAMIGGANTMFVEDAIRRISLGLESMEGVRDWIVKCTHMESIHESEAIAINWKGVDGGFDGTYFIRG